MSVNSFRPERGATEFPWLIARPRIVRTSHAFSLMPDPKLLPQVSGRVSRVSAALRIDALLAESPAPGAFVSCFANDLLATCTADDEKMILPLLLDALHFLEGLSDELKYALVAGAVTGGGLTVIANAPNPAGAGILQDAKVLEDEGISPLGLFLGALPPTLVAIVFFWLLH